MKSKRNSALNILFRGLIAIFELTLILFANEPSWASPHPATSSSVLVSSQLGLFRSPYGFELNSGKTGWIHLSAENNTNSVETLYQAPSLPSKTKDKKESQTSPVLTVRVDRLEKETQLGKYSQRWLKEYPKYGFDVLGSKAFSMNKQKGQVIDIVHHDSGKQLRQVVFIKDKLAVILTCRDQVEHFKEALKSCNQIVRTFQWIE